MVEAGGLADACRCWSASARAPKQAPRAPVVHAIRGVQGRMGRGFQQQVPHLCRRAVVGTPLVVHGARARRWAVHVGIDL
eukprot:scaffold152506_cov18-Tisochrysis_lutea.AAC.2